MEIRDEYLERILQALEHYAAYMKASTRDPRPYTDVIEELKRKPPTSETGDKESAKKRRA